MKDAKTPHSEAMDFAERAVLAKHRGDHENSVQLFRQAFEKEREAAIACYGRLAFEPTRSVLYRSAASLAVECGELREAERLIAVALAGNPPEEIANELRDLLEQVYFHRHLELRGITLSPEEIQFSIAGRGIGFGIAPSEEFVARVQAFEKLVHRTAERKLGLSYRERGRPERDIRDNFELFVTVPRAASLAVTLKIGRKREQMRLPLEKEVEVEEVIDDIFYCLENLNSGRWETVKKHIETSAYYNNFVALARRIAPDGQDVDQVGMTVYRAGEKRRLAITMSAGATGEWIRMGIRQSGFVLSPPIEADPRELPNRVEVSGKLRFADSTSGDTGRIKLIDQAGAEHTVIVPEGMMSDIVRPLWDSNVEVIGTQTQEGILMENIRSKVNQRSERPKLQ